MTRPHAPPSVPALALVLVAFLAALGARDARAQLPTVGAPRRALSQHVVIVSIDGLRPDAIARARAPTLQRLAREGRATIDALTILPSLTLPSHSSMLTGVQPDVHGVTWNDEEVDRYGYIGVPTIFGIAKDAGLVSAAFYSKAKLRHLMVPGTLAAENGPSRVAARGGEQTLRALRGYLRRGGRPNILFVHLADVDYAGHAEGWMSWGYTRAVRHVDAMVAGLIAASDAAFGRGGYTVILTADHGGDGRTHGTATVSDQTIPWVAWGAGVAPGPRLRAGVRTMDTAATALWLLGLPVPTDWTGQPVATAFDSLAGALP